LDEPTIILELGLADDKDRPHSGEDDVESEQWGESVCWKMIVLRDGHQSVWLSPLKRNGLMQLMWTLRGKACPSIPSA